MFTSRGALLAHIHKVNPNYKPEDFKVSTLPLSWNGDARDITVSLATDSACVVAVGHEARVGKIMECNYTLVNDGQIIDE